MPNIVICQQGEWGRVVWIDFLINNRWQWYDNCAASIRGNRLISTLQIKRNFLLNSALIGPPFIWLSTSEFAHADEARLSWLLRSTEMAAISNNVNVIYGDNRAN